MALNPLTKDEISKDLNFEVGQQYLRMDLHEVCGGNHQPGISPIDDLSAILLFGSPSKNEPWYDDEWLANDHFSLTGVGRVGDQLWDGSFNKSLARHEEDDRRVFLFERIPETKPTAVTYVGEFKYVKHKEIGIEGVNGEDRLAYQFELKPKKTRTVELPDNLNELKLETLYKRASQVSNGGTPTSSGGSSPSKGGDNRTTSEVVREFALRAADGVCQGCNQDAPFKTDAGKKYLEVHHITKVSDDGPDHPDNVIALCPNCHSEVHNGQKGSQLNEKLREKAKNRTASLTN